MTNLGPDDDDTLDGCCDADFNMGAPTSDEDRPYVVLFASVLGPDNAVRDGRRLLTLASEWRQLFGGDPYGP